MIAPPEVKEPGEVDLCYYLPGRIFFKRHKNTLTAVLPRDLQLCSETASGVDVGGQHEWGELVQLDPQTVGVIVRLERETFQVCVLHAGASSPSSSSSWEVAEQGGREPRLLRVQTWLCHAGLAV